MTSLFQNLFDPVSFPIFSTDLHGKIIYKNAATKRFFPSMRIGSDLKRYLFSGSMLSTDECITIDDGIGYCRALPLIHGEYILFFAFSRLQFSDHEEVTARFLTAIRKDPESFLHLFDCNAQPKDPAPRAFPRILAELTRPNSVNFGTDTVHIHHSAILIGAMLNQMQSIFPSLGIRMSMTIDNDFISTSTIHVAPYDIAHLFGMLVYCLLRVSKKRTLTITLTSDPLHKEHHIIFSITEPLPALHSTAEILTLMASIAPECRAELLLLQHTLISDIFLRIFTQNEVSSLHLAIPYTAINTSLHSPVRDTRFLGDLRLLSNRIAFMLSNFRPEEYAPDDFALFL